jgi:lactoylglutathione lyase
MTVVHHTAVCSRDIDASLRFWCDGLGFEVLMDETFTGDWPTLLHAPSNSLRSVFLGRPGDFDSGIVELVDLGLGPRDDRPAAEEPGPGFLLISVMVDVEKRLAALRRSGLGGEPRRVTTQGVPMAVVRDPDGVLVELIGTRAITRLGGAIDDR